MFLDATYVKARSRGRVVSKAVIVATGVTRGGDREVLGVEVGDTEDGAFWIVFLPGLRARGLAGVKLVISDAHLGLGGDQLGDARRRLAALPRASCPQRVGEGPEGSADMVAAAMRTIFAQPDAPHVQASSTRSSPCSTAVPRRRRDPQRRQRRPPRLLRVPPRGLEKDLVHQPTRTPQRRDQTPHPRRGIFPNDAAVLRLVSAVVAETHDEWQDAERRYLAEHTMNLLYEAPIEPLDTKEVMPARIAS